MKKTKIVSALLAAATVLGMALSASAVSNTLPGEGYIGLDPATNPGTLINVTLPTGNFEWAYTDVTAPNITAPTYTIKNNSTVVDLEVTMEEFTQTNAVVIPGALTLNLTGIEMAFPNVIGTTGNTTKYATDLGMNSTWSFSFGGTYVGAIPATALQPEYDMILNFEIA